MPDTDNTDWSRTIGYIVATGAAVIFAYYAGNIIGYINGHRRGRTTARRVGDHEPHLGWGDIDGWQ